MASNAVASVEWLTVIAGLSGVVQQNHYWNLSPGYVYAPRYIGALRVAITSRQPSFPRCCSTEFTSQTIFK